MPFDIFSREMVEAARTGNPFLERRLLIARIDQIARNDDLKAKLDQAEWDLSSLLPSMAVLPPLLAQRRR